MNVQDRIVEIFLSLFDHIMDLFTLGKWTQIRGGVVPNIKIKK